MPVEEQDLDWLAQHEAVAHGLDFGSCGPCGPVVSLKLDVREPPHRIPTSGERCAPERSTGGSSQHHTSNATISHSPYSSALKRSSSGRFEAVTYAIW